MHLLSSRNRSEFLAVPQLVRLTLANGINGPEATLLVKSSTLTLKYLLRLKRFRFVLLRISDEWNAYGIRIEDDPEHSAVLWSLLEYKDEAKALRTLTRHQKCVVFLFNELAVNVAWGETNLNLSDRSFRSLLKSAALHPIEETNASTEVSQRLDEWYRGTLAAHHGLSQELEVQEWHPIRSHYITNRISNSVISIFEDDEGGQQEQAALWLIDGLHAEGAILSPQIHETNKVRELSDILISYHFGAFLIESKTLAIMARETLPSREKLSRTVTKHLQKATKQLIGGVKNLRRGHRVTDIEGKDVEVERTNPTHVIVLVPDLSLLANASEFGGEFIRRASSECGGIFHILDPSELLRIVQAAEMISRNSKTVTRMMAFDYYLIERLKRAVVSKTPNFAILFRNRPEEPQATK
jgi:hypothetical protein